MNQKNLSDHKKFARGIGRGLSIRRAMLEAGYSPSTANRGKAALSKPMVEALAAERTKLEALGRRISPERQQNLVRGRLVLNVMRGKDAGTQSARLLGADKRVSMWQPDSQVGMVILSPPPVRVIQHAVEILPPEHPEDLEVEDDSR